MVLTKEGVIDKAKDPDAAAARLYDVALAIEGLTVSPREATPELFRTSVYNLVKDNVWGRIFAEDLAAFYEDAYNEAVSSGDFSKLGRVCHALAGGVRRAAELHLASAASER